MNHLCKFFILSLLTINAYSQELISPQVVSTSGNSFKLNSMTVDWTIGEVAVTTMNNGKTILSQGFHQTYKTTTNLIEPKSNKNLISIYPNPVAEQLEIISTVSFSKRVTLTIIDINGSLVQSLTKTIDRNTSIDVRSIPAGNYILLIYTDISNYFGAYKFTKID